MRGVERSADGCTQQAAGPMQRTALIDQNRLEVALRRLAKSDVECAEAKGEELRSEHMAKTAENLAYKAATGSIEDRKREAQLSEGAQAAWAKHFEAVVLHEKLKAKRQREMLIVEVWRTLESSRRKGTIQ